LQRNAAAETRDNAEIQVIALRQRLRGETKRNPEFCLARGECEPSGHDSDDGIGLVIQTDGAAKYAGISAKHGPPKMVAEQYGVRRIVALVLGGKAAPEGGA